MKEIGDKFFCKIFAAKQLNIQCYNDNIGLHMKQHWHRKSNSCSAVSQLWYIYQRITVHSAATNFSCRFSYHCISRVVAINKKWSRQRTESSFYHVTFILKNAPILHMSLSTMFVCYLLTWNAWPFINNLKNMKTNKYLNAKYWQQIVKWQVYYD